MLQKSSPHHYCFSIQGAKDDLHHILSSGPFTFPQVTTQVPGDLVVHTFIQNVSKHTSMFIFLK